MCTIVLLALTVILSNIQENPHGFYGLIQTTDISFPRNREGSLKPLKTLWRSTMGVQSSSTLATLCIGVSASIFHWVRQIISFNQYVSA